MPSTAVADVIVHSQRPELVKAASEHLKMKGVSNILTPVSPEDCIEALQRFPKGLLIIDWELGQKVIAAVLGFNRRKFVAENRPILLVASGVEDRIIATAAEYNVTQIFTEAITLKNLGSRLTNMIISDSVPNDIKKTLQAVAEARKDGNHKDALNLLQKTLQKHPTHLRIKCEAAETLMALGEWDKAYALLSGLQTAQPPNLRAIHLIGRCLMKQGKMAEAVRTLESAALFNPNDAERLVDIGNCFLQLDRVNDAGARFDAALGIAPDLREAKLGKGQVKLMDGLVNDALSILREVASELEMASLFNTTAILNARRGRHEAGQNLYQAGLKALGKDDRLQARLYFNMGIGFRRWGKPEKAISCFEMATKLDPKFEKARDSLAEVRAGKAPKVKKPRPAQPEAPERNSSGHTPAGSALIDLGMIDAPFDDDDLMEESLFDATKL